MSEQENKQNLGLEEKQAPGTEEKRSVLKKKRKRRRWRATIIPVFATITFVVVAMCAIKVVLIFEESGAPLFGSSNTVELPNLVGRNEEEVVRFLEGGGNKKLIKEYIYEYNDNSATIGKVVSQRPSPKIVKATQKVVVVINKGPQDVKVPDVTGMTADKAKEAIEAVGLVPYIKTVYDEESTAQIGRVIDTEPAAGRIIKNATNEDMVVVNIAGQRLSAKKVKVPSFVGYASVADAQALAAANNIELSVTREASAEPPGTILSQMPGAGATLDAYSTVRVTVAVSPEELEPPAA